MVYTMGSSVWSPVEDTRCYGVAKYYFQPKDELKANCGIEINIGETVRIKGESREWFYVQKNDSHEEGILPKSYVHIQECSISRHGDTDIILPRWPPTVQEITSVLRDWHRLAKNLFLTHSTDFAVIRHKILELHDCRRRNMCPNLTVEGLRNLKKQVANVIDTGNNLLKLDMTVRDDNGNPLNPSVTSTIELFRQHQRASNKLKRQGGNSQRKSQIPTYHSHSLLVTLEKISWRVVDECEIRVFLHDADLDQPFTESGQLTMKVGDSVTSKFPARFLFTDLGKKDMDRKRIYLVAYVFRIGAMEYKEPEARRENTPFSQRSSQQIRRPWGVAAKEISEVFREVQTPKEDKEDLLFMPYMSFGEFDCMETALHKLLASKEATGKETKVGIYCSLSMLYGTPTQLQEDQPLMVRNNPTITRKMGFPEVILPNDVRNDLYIKLIRGEFHRGAKTTDKNVEVTVSVYHRNGDLLKDLIYGGSGSVACNQYKSVVYYHDDKPKWSEIFKISLPISIEEFNSGHLKFTFKHRSSSETKDRQERPFALAYVPLQNVDGTAIADGLHELIVYKIDPKHYRETDINYLGLPSSKQKPWESISKPQCPGFSLSNKDNFSVQTTLCSTKFTQNAQLLELLQWSTKLKTLADQNIAQNTGEQKSQEEQVEDLLKGLKQVLVKVTKVSGDEIVKFLPDVFDALFLILVDPIESIQSELRQTRQSLIIQQSFFENGNLLTETCDRPVFECLIYIFGLILDHKYQNFKSVLSLYIEDGFSSALAYKKLIAQLQYYIGNAENGADLNQVLKIMKSIEYFFKFIIRSFSIRIRLRDIKIGQATDGPKDEIEFERSIEDLFRAMSKLLRFKDVTFVAAQGGCLKHIPSVIEHLCTVFPSGKLSELLFEIIVAVPAGKLTTQKLTTIKDIVHSPLFLDPTCRTMLFPIVAQSILNHLPGNDDEVKRKKDESAKIRSKNKIGYLTGVDTFESHSKHIVPAVTNHSEETGKCVELLSDVMDILFREDIGATQPDISYLMQRLLKPIIFSNGTIGDDHALAGEMLAILLSLFREMNSKHYSILFSLLKGDLNSNSATPYKHELLKFLNDVLVVEKNLFSKPCFPLDWSEMILLQNSIVLTTLDHFSGIIKAEYADPFEEQPWNNFFQSAVSFLTQPSLQLEDFSQNKCMVIQNRYGDMRKKAAALIRVMWFSLGESKRVHFVPVMVGTFLDMTLVPEPELRRSTIPIFFDMMHCEFDRSGSIKPVEDELIQRLVEFVEIGKGDRAFREIFHDTMSHCVSQCHFNAMGVAMVKTISRLLDLLLEYREVVHEDDPCNRMTCIVNLLDFSKEINRKDLYLRYLYKLHDLHIVSNNFTEAAFTLKLHSRQLDWTDDEIPRHLQSLRHSNAITQYELKEALYNDTISYLIKSKMWECALEVCDELRQQYAEESFNYAQLPILLRQMATFYEEINKKNRLNPAYFRVAFYGRDFPSFLQDKSYIYRGKESERLAEFESTMMERFPRAELLRFLNFPSEDIRSSNKQFLQICNVEPLMGTTSSKRMSAMKNADECVRRYYKSNEIEKFTYSRPYYREPRESDNEFSSRWLDRYTLWTSQSFPGIMNWFPVVRETATQIRPIVHAIEELEKTNRVMRELIISHCSSPNESISPLSMKLNGILDAAVMGGIANYEKAFLTDSYLEKNPEDFSYVDTLKSTICVQVPILEQGLKIHEMKAPPSLVPLHRKLEECFKEFLKHVEKEYHVQPLELKDEGLTHEMDRLKKRQSLVFKEGIGLAKEQAGSRNSEFISSGFRTSSQALARSMGSFSSTISLYSNHKVTGSKSMQSISRYDFHRRSTTQQSLVEASCETLLGSNTSATLPRNGVFSSLSSTSTLNSPPIVGEIDFGNNNKSRDGSQLPVIHLTQTLTTQRPSRAEQRKSINWPNGNGENGNRSSGISISSLTHTPESSSCNSFNFAEEDEAPPLPPKQKGENKPPTPPPKKPPRHV